MALEMLQGLLGEDTAMGALGEDTMEGGLGGGTGITPPFGYQIPVNRQPAQGGLAGAAPTDSLSTAREGYLKATQEMIDALQQRISGQGYDISRLLFAFGQPTSTGSIGSALANVGAEASRQRAEQEKAYPSLAKMRLDLAGQRLSQEQARALQAAMASEPPPLPGANVSAAPGSGLGQGQPKPAVQSYLDLPYKDARSFIVSMVGEGPDSAALIEKAMGEWMKYNKMKSDQLVPVGGSIFNKETGAFTQNPSEGIKANPMFVNIGEFSGELPMTSQQAQDFTKARSEGGDYAAAQELIRMFPHIASRIGSIAPPRAPIQGNVVRPVQAAESPVAPEQAAQPPAQPAPPPAAQPAPQSARPFETQSEKEQRLKIEAEQAKQDIGMLSDEIKEARSPILTRYDKAPAVLQEAKQMTSLASTYPYAIGIFNKPGMGPAIAQVLKEGLRVAPGIAVQLGGFEDAVRRVVKADPDMVARVAREQNMSTDQAQRYLQQQGLDAVSLLLQSERRLDNLLNKAERKNEGSVSNFERVYFAQALPSLSNDPVKAYLLKTLALQEMAKFDQKVGELLMRRSESKQYDPRKMYQSDEYKTLRNNYINSLEGITREFFPEFANKQFKEIRKQTGV